MSSICILVTLCLGISATHGKTHQYSDDREGIHSELKHVYEMIAASNKRIDETSQKMGKLNSSNKKLEDMVQNLTLANINLKIDLEKSLEGKMAQLKRSNDNVLERMKLVGKKQRGQQNNESYVSFTAYSTQYREYAAGITVLFDGIVRNYGNYFNSEISIFFCPVNGYYMFALNAWAGTTGGIDLEIVVDGEALVATNAHNQTDHGSASVITYCPATKLVSVNCINTGGRMYGDPDLHYSTFSGTLLLEV